MYNRNIMSRKGSALSVNGAGGSEALRSGFRGQSSLTKFLGSTEYLDFVLLNSVQEFIEVQVWLPLTFLLCLHNQFISICYIVI